MPLWPTPRPGRRRAAKRLAAWLRRGRWILVRREQEPCNCLTLLLQMLQGGKRCEMGRTIALEGLALLWVMWVGTGGRSWELDRAGQ